MRRIIVSFIGGAAEVLAVLFVVVAAVAGMATAGPLAALAMGVGAFVVASIVFGLLFIALDIRDNLQTIAERAKDTHIVLHQMRSDARELDEERRADKAAQTTHTTPRVLCRCSQCGHEFDVQARLYPAKPIVCPQCGLTLAHTDIKIAATEPPPGSRRVACRCPRCFHEFVLMAQPTDSPVACPKCGAVVPEANTETV